MNETATAILLHYIFIRWDLAKKIKLTWLSKFYLLSRSLQFRKRTTITALHQRIKAIGNKSTKNNTVF